MVIISHMVGKCPVRNDTGLVEKIPGEASTFFYPTDDTALLKKSVKGFADVDERS